MDTLTAWRRQFRDALGDGEIVGVGIAPFMKVAPAFLLPHYRLVCLRATRDLPLLREHLTVQAIQEHHRGATLETNSAAEVLRHPWTQDLLAHLPKPLRILVYKGTESVCSLAEEHGWELIANHNSVRTPLELKGEFPALCAEAGIEALPSEHHPARSIDAAKLRELLERYGSPVVLQVADQETAGGTATGFIRTEGDLAAYMERRRKMDPKGMYTIKATQFVRGEAASILACVTPRGVVTSVVQNQVVDRPELVRTDKGSGLFCGHDWSVRFSPAVQQQASRIARAFGAVMATRGYRGVFGLDLIVTAEERVVPIECNARYTGAFPFISLLQMADGVAPLDAYHLGAFLGVDWEWGVQEAEEALQRPLTGGHLILMNTLDTPVVTRGDVLPGVHRLTRDGVEFVRPGFSFEEIRAPGEFALVSGIPYPGSRYRAGSEFSRICHILAREPLVTRDGSLTDWAATVATRTREAFALEPLTEGAQAGAAGA